MVCSAKPKYFHTSDDSVHRKYQHIVSDIDLSYRIVEKNIKFFNISRYCTPEEYVFITALPK